jgi:hypothetical protein
MRLGLIQSRGIGDIIIALPIADYFIERGWEVCWPIDEQFVPFFAAAKPEIRFIPLKRDEGRFFYETPLAMLNDLGCKQITVLYSHLKGHNVSHAQLALSLKFDEYKYAVAGVPFSKKWDLRIKRDPAREMELTSRLQITRPYICVHKAGSNFDATGSLDLPKRWTDQYQFVDITPVTDNPFDWISVLERASKLVLIDSCFSNLVEQLNMTAEKYLLLRSDVSSTPVMKNGWKFIAKIPPAGGELSVKQ